jgi:hypothetical protein
MQFDAEPELPVNEITSEFVATHTRATARFLTEAIKTVKERGDITGHLEQARDILLDWLKPETLPFTWLSVEWKRDVSKLPFISELRDSFIYQPWSTANIHEHAYRAHLSLADTIFGEEYQRLLSEEANGSLTKEKYNTWLNETLESAPCRAAALVRKQGLVLSRRAVVDENWGCTQSPYSYPTPFTYKPLHQKFYPKKNASGH